MIYALNLDTDNRILSATYDQFAPQSQPRVNTLPEGDISEYLYVNDEYIYDPIPVPPEPTPEPSADEILDVLLGVEDNE